MSTGNPPIMNDSDVSWILILGSTPATIQQKIAGDAARCRKVVPQQHRVRIYELNEEQFGITFDPPAPLYWFLHTINSVTDSPTCPGVRVSMGWYISPEDGERYFFRCDLDGMGDTLWGMSSRGVRVSVDLWGRMKRCETKFQVVTEPMFPTVAMKEVATFDVIFDADPELGTQLLPDESLQPRESPPTTDSSKIYPYVVPSGYLEGVDPGPPGFYLALGHDIHALPYRDLGNSCVNIRPRDMSAAGLNAAQLHQLALENLLKLAKGTAFTKSLHQTPNGTPFLVWTGHWLAASCSRLPSLFKFASKHLQAEKLCVSIPHRELMIIFPFGTLEQRQQLRAMIYENEKEARKLITWELFTLTAAGLKALSE